jgi:hypothetical protein
VILAQAVVWGVALFGLWLGWRRGWWSWRDVRGA